METQTFAGLATTRRMLLALAALGALAASMLVVAAPVAAAPEASTTACNNVINGGRSPDYVWVTTDASGLTVHWNTDAAFFGNSGTVVVRACIDLDGDDATTGDQHGAISQNAPNDGSEFFPWALFGVEANPCPSNAFFGGSVDTPVVQTKKSDLIDCSTVQATPTPTPTMAATPPEGDNASLNVKKTDEGGHALAGAVFTVEGMEGTFTTGDNGKFCITGLPNDSQWLVTEIQAPPGYQLADPASQLVEVDDDGDCNSASAKFVNALATPTPTPEGSVAGGTSTPSPTPEGSVQGGTGTPEPSQPDTAMGMSGGPSPIPTVAFGLILLAALGALAWANVKSARSRA